MSYFPLCLLSPSLSLALSSLRLFLALSSESVLSVLVPCSLLLGSLLGSARSPSLLDLECALERGFEGALDLDTALDGAREPRREGSREGSLDGTYWYFVVVMDLPELSLCVESLPFGTVNRFPVRGGSSSYTLPLLPSEPRLERSLL